MSRFTNLVDEIMKHGSADAVLNARVDEVSPPGFKGTVKAMKDEGEVDNPYKLAWWMKNKGYKSHKKADGTAKEALGESDHLTRDVVGGIVRHIAAHYPEVFEKHGREKVEQVAHDETYWLTSDWPEDEGFGGSDSYGPVKSTLAVFGIDHDAELQKRREAEAQRREAPQQKVGESPFNRVPERDLTPPGDSAEEAIEALIDEMTTSPRGNEAILGMAAEKLGHDANDWQMVLSSNEEEVVNALYDIMTNGDSEELANYSNAIARHLDQGPEYEPEFEEATGSGVDVDEIDIPDGVGGHAYDDDLTLDDLDTEGTLSSEPQGGTFQAGRLSSEPQLGDVEETVGHGEPPEEIDMDRLVSEIMADPGANQELMQAAASLAGYGQHDMNTVCTPENFTKLLMSFFQPRVGIG